MLTSPRRTDAGYQEHALQDLKVEPEILWWECLCSGRADAVPNTMATPFNEADPGCKADPVALLRPTTPTYLHEGGFLSSVCSHGHQSRSGLSCWQGCSCCRLVGRGRSRSALRIRRGLRRPLPAPSHPQYYQGPVPGLQTSQARSPQWPEPLRGPGRAPRPQQLRTAPA